MIDLFFKNQTIMVGDCLIRFAEIASESIDIIISSPPYNLGIAYHSYDDKQPRDRYLRWLDAVSVALHRLITPTGSLFLNVGGSNADPWLAMDVANMFRSHFTLQNHIMWVKSISIGETTYGHFKPINSPRYLNYNHESIFHFTRSGHVPIDRLAVGVPFTDKGNIARRGHTQDRRCAGNTWHIPYPTVQSKAQKFDHPAPFPVALAERCIKLHGGGRVLDPFAGTGSTLVAAYRQGYSGIGIEIDPLYAATALARLEAS